MGKGNGGAAAAIIISIILSVGIGLGAYFGLPYLFPSMNSPAFVYQEYESEIILYDSETTWQEFTDINVNFTKEQDSRIQASFDSTIMLYTASTDRNEYEYALCVQGAGNRTVYVGYIDSSFTTGFIEVTNSFHLAYTTAILPAGTYKVSLWGHSLVDHTGLSYTLINNPIINYTTSLTVQEIL